VAARRDGEVAYEVSISVIVPTHNRPDLTRAAIASVRRQRILLLETIVVDDGSTDNSIEQLRALATEDANVKILLQAQSGAAVARNFGAASAMSDVLVFLDSDDELLPECCERFAMAFADPSIGAVCSAAEFVNATGTVVSTSKPRELGPAYEGERGLFLAGTFAVRRQVFEAVGGFAAECRSSQHTEFSLRLIPYLKKAGLRLAVIDAPTVRVRTSDRNHLRGNLDNLLEGALYIIRHHEQQLRKSPKHYSDWCSIAAVYAAKLGRFAEAQQLLYRAVRAYPRKAANFVRLALTLCPPLARRVWRAETIR